MTETGQKYVINVQMVDSEKSQLKQEKMKPNRIKQTVYIEDDLSKWIRHRIADSREEISDVVNKALRLLQEQSGK